MGRRSRRARVATMTAVALAGLAFAAPSASAVFHLMKIREVAPNPAGPDSSFVELQMYEAGQNFVGGHVVNSYQANGMPAGSFTMTGNVPNGENQRTILLGDTATPGAPDFVDGGFAQYFSTLGAGGAV